VRRDIGKRWYDDYGVLHINLIDFLLDKTVI
jgi:AAA+ superfamily ATPase